MGPTEEQKPLPGQGRRQRRRDGVWGRRLPLWLIEVGAARACPPLPWSRTRALRALDIAAVACYPRFLWCGWVRAVRGRREYKSPLARRNATGATTTSKA